MNSGFSYNLISLLQSTLRSPVAVKCQIFFLPRSSYAALNTKYSCHQICTGIFRDFEAYNSAGVQIKNDAEVKPIAFHSKISNITHPCLVWMLRCKAAFQPVLFLLLLPLLKLLLYLGMNTLQIQFLHDRRAHRHCSFPRGIYPPAK